VTQWRSQEKGNIEIKEEILRKLEDIKNTTESLVVKVDLKYGFDRSNKDASIHLHAHKIEFVHPVSNEMISIVAPTPKDPIWEACN
jgi:hypothetical protein